MRMRSPRNIALLTFVLGAFGCGGSAASTVGGGDDASGDDAGGDVGDDSTPWLLGETDGCTPTTCGAQGKNCGKVDDGCGGSLDCGVCPGILVCGAQSPNVCGCVPKTCTALGVNCGQQSDGCGGLIDCGTCTAPETCGGSGKASVCGGVAVTCKPKACADFPTGACGPQSDGCGGLTANCGSCTAPQTCGGGGVAGQCGGGPAPCTAKTCASFPAGTCGPQSDGCGGLTPSCGSCTAPQVCGGGGVAGQCGGGPAPCTAKTCADFPAGTCGAQADGCGGLTANCNPCTAPKTCGGGGVANQCGGGPPACTPKTCADFPAGSCGQLSDGCAGLTANCGSCTAPQVCGGGGVAGQCGGGPAPCTPKTCAAFPAGTCGQMSDGCGGLTASCGTCTAPETCGGAGVPSQCGRSCVNLECKQVICTGTATTAVTGTIYDPAGNHPLPNVNVYVPNGTVKALSPGYPVCDGCSSGITGSPLVKTTTDVNGNFTLTNVPYGTGIPVVLQLGKWRRQVTVDTARCGSVALDAPGTPKASLKGRLPRNQSEGDMPQIAMATGNADPLECLLRKIGISDSEFTNPTGTGRVNLYSGYDDGTNSPTKSYAAGLGGAAFPAATSLWNSDAATATSGTHDLASYDVVLLGCEGQETTLNKPNAALKALQDYANGGGRVFGEHFHYAWMKYASGLTGAYRNWSTMVTWSTTLVYLNGPEVAAAVTSDPYPYTRETVSTAFPKASLMNQWLQSPAIGAATVASPSTFPVNGGRRSITTINDTADILQWIATVPTTYAADFSAGVWVTYPTAFNQYFSFDTPVATSPACGRFVFSDLHVSSGDATNTAFPNGCTTTTMSAQELALEYMFFDIASPVCGGAVTPPTCTPTTCSASGLSCGSAPDGCGGALSCGTCPTGSFCSGGVCKTSMCTPTTCAALGYNCGTWSDGCGGTLGCGACTSPASCGGGGKIGVCGGTTCTKTTCSALGLSCGSASDGCGGSLSCGTCPTGSFCSGGACKTSTCTATTCSALGLSCGSASDGCGGSLSCGTCPTGSFCSGGACKTSTCTAATCASLGYDCGSWADGCGGTLVCGSCVAPKTCGGGGKPGVCGGTSCAPTTCAALGYNCGLWADGCGGSLNCGACPAPATCAGGGLPGVCGGTPCAPTTCAKLGFDCGKTADGCGGVLDCGACSAPDSCGGGGTANVCGHIQ
jgi:hypothetical protein